MENFPAINVPAVSVALIARTLGRKWQNVEDNAKIRVPKAGKRICIVLSINGPCRIDWSSLKLDLHDLGASSVGLDSIVANWTRLGTPQISESLNRCKIELHLEQMRKQLQFRGKLNTDSGEELLFSSVTFRSSNSGTSHAERKKEDLIQTCANYLGRDNTRSHLDASATFSSRGNLAVQGRLTAMQFITFSDIQLKENVEDLLDSLNRVLELQGRKYTWKPGNQSSNMENRSPEFRLGFIAQHVAEHFPEIVEQTSDGYLTVAYAHLVPAIIEALKYHMNKMKQLQDSQEELLQLSERYRQLVSDLRVEPLDSSPSQIRASPRAYLPPKSKRRKPFSSLCRATFTGSALSVRVAAIATPLLVLTVLILGLSLGITNMPHTPPAAPVMSPPPLRIVNYLSDGGFEDPQSSLWTGNFTTASYATSVWPPGALMKSLAPFSAQDRFLLLNSTPPSMNSFAFQPLAGIPNFSFNMSVWCYLAANTSLDAEIKLSIGFSTTSTASTSLLNQGPCCSTAYADLRNVGSWQLLQVLSTCASFDPRDRLAVTLSVSGSSAIVAFDSLTLEPIEGIPLRNRAFGLAGTSNIVLNEFTGSKIRAFTSFLDPNGAYYAGIVDIDSLRVGFVRYLVPDLDQSLGIEGVVWTDFVLMESENAAQSIEADSIGRVVVAGAALSAYGAPSAAVSRFNNDGTRDLTFGNRGTVYLTIPDTVKPSRVVCSGIHMPLDDKIVTLWHLSYANGTFMSFVARLLPNGAMDVTFGAAGLVPLPPDLSQSVALAEDDQYLCIAAVNANRIHLAKLSVNGVVNMTWSGTSPTTVSFNASAILRVQLMLSAPSGYTVASTIQTLEGNMVALARFSANGSVDASFGVNGTSVIVSGNLITFETRFSDEVICIVSNQSQSFFLSIFPNGTLDRRASTALSRYSTGSAVDGLITTGAQQTVSGSLWFLTTNFNDTIRTARRWLLPQFPPGWSPQLVLPTRPTSTRLLVADSNLQTRLFLGSQNLRSSFAISAVAAATGALDLSWGQGRGFAILKGSARNDQLLLHDFISLPSGSFIVLSLDGDLLTESRCLGVVIAHTFSNSSLITPQIRLQRLLTDGAVDVLFNCVLSPPMNVSQVKIRASPTGSLYVSAQDINSTAFIIWRIDTIGTIDATWNAGAPLTVTAQQLASASFSAKFDIVVAADNLFIVSSNESFSSSSGFILKLTSSGARDNSCGANGLTFFSTDASSSTGLTRAMVTEPSSLYLGGWRTNATSTSAVVLKISSQSGAQDPAFDASLISAAIGTEISVDRLLYESNSSSIVVLGAVSTPKVARRAFLARLDPILGTPRCNGPAPVSWLDDGISSNVVGAVEVGESYVLATDIGTSMHLASFSARWQQLCNPLCGNAIVEAFEECDDGNRFGGDGCSATCNAESAG